MSAEEPTPAGRGLMTSAPSRNGTDFLPGIDLAYAGKACGKAVSEDFFDASRPPRDDLARRGVVFALADGLSGGAGRRAAETCVGGLLADVYSAPSAWPTARCLDRVIGSLNGWLASHNQRSEPEHCMLTTLTVLVVRGAELHVAHVGDTRLYRVRAGAAECMTTDHVWPRRDMRSVLRRAVGLDRHVVVDVIEDEVLAGDRFALLSDGVWEVLGEEVVQKLLVERASPATIAADLVERACARQRAYYGRNDASAAVVEVREIPR